MDWLQTLVTPAVLLALAAFAWRVQRAHRADDQRTFAGGFEALRGELRELRTEVRADVRELRADVRELSRDVAGLDKRLVAVETLLHERTGRPVPAREPVAVE